MQEAYNNKLVKELIITSAFKKSKLGFNKNSLNFCAAMPDSPFSFWKTMGLQLVANQVAIHSPFYVDFAFVPDDLLVKNDATRNGLKMLFSNELVKQVDIIGVSMMSPILIFNMFSLLELIGMPLLKKNRTFEDPLLIAGNSGIINPAPFEDFVDIFVIGDGEEPIVEIMEIFDLYKQKAKTDLLKQIAKIKGVYVPEFTRRKYNKSGELIGVSYKGNANGVVRPVVIDFSKKPRRGSLIIKKDEFPIITIDYSCKYKCGFCQMSNFRGAYQELDSQKIKSYLLEFDKLGIKKVALTGSCVGQYSQLKEIFEWAKKELDTCKPFIYGSLRSNDAKYISSVLPEEIIIAPETGDEYLRNKVLLKTLNDHQIKEDIKYLITQTPVRRLKMFIIVGIPTETDKDLRKAKDLIYWTSKVFKKEKEWGTIVMKLSPLVPQPGTPFEEYGMMGIGKFKKIEDKFYKEITKLLPEGINFEIETWSYMDYLIQGIINTGDRPTGKIALNAYKNNPTSKTIIDAYKEEMMNNKNLTEYIPKGNWHVKPWDMIKSRNHMQIQRAKEIIKRNIKLRV